MKPSERVEQIALELYDDALRAGWVCGLSLGALRQCRADALLRYLDEEYEKNQSKTGYESLKEFGAMAGEFPPG